MIVRTKKDITGYPLRRGSWNVVYAMCLVKDALEILVINESYGFNDVSIGPVWLPLCDFDTIQDEISGLWHFAGLRSERYTYSWIWGYADLVQTESHLADLEEREPSAVQTFMVARRRLYIEAAIGNVFQFTGGDAPMHDAPNLVEIPGHLNDESAVLHAYRTLINLPSYCGNDLTGLSECLKHLSWMKPYERSMTVVHYELPALDHEQLSEYLCGLFEVVLYWRSCGERFGVVFSDRDRRQVRRVLEHSRLQATEEALKLPAGVAPPWLPLSTGQL